MGEYGLEITIIGDYFTESSREPCRGERVAELGFKCKLILHGRLAADGDEFEPGAGCFRCGYGACGSIRILAGGECEEVTCPAVRIG
jgi:hypothetical protein